MFVLFLNLKHISKLQKQQSILECLKSFKSCTKLSININNIVLFISKKTLKIFYPNYLCDDHN